MCQMDQEGTDSHHVLGLTGWDTPLSLELSFTSCTIAWSYQSFYNPAGYHCPGAFTGLGQAHARPVPGSQFCQLTHLHSHLWEISYQGFIWFCGNFCGCEVMHGDETKLMNDNTRPLPSPGMLSFNNRWFQTKLIQCCQLCCINFGPVVLGRSTFQMVSQF